MAQKTEFRVLPERLGTAGEQIASCRSKAERLAEQLAEIQRGLKGSSSSIGQIERSVAVLQEDIRGQAKRMNLAAEAVRFSANRYSNAERGILGQPLLAFGSSSSGDTKKAAGSGTGSSGRKRKPKGRQKNKAFCQQGCAVCRTRYPQPRGSCRREVDRSVTSKPNPDGRALTYKKSETSYGNAYVRTKIGPDGKPEENCQRIYRESKSSVQRA